MYLSLLDQPLLFLASARLFSLHSFPLLVPWSLNPLCPVIVKYKLKGLGCKVIYLQYYTKRGEWSNTPGERTSTSMLVNRLCHVRLPNAQSILLYTLFCIGCLFLHVKKLPLFLRGVSCRSASKSWKPCTFVWIIGWPILSLVIRTLLKSPIIIQGIYI